MFITISQIIIFICIICFMLFNLIGVYYYQETYNTRKIKITDPDTVWMILSSICSGSRWWNKLEKLDVSQENIDLIDSFKKNRLKLLLKNINNKDEIWTFVFTVKNKENYLIVKKQTLVNSKTSDFLNKYLNNNRDIKLFVKDFENELSKSVT